VQWPADRLHHFAKIFQIVRVGGTINFFRQFVVPEHSIRGVLGRFHPAQPVTYGELDTWSLWETERYVEPYATPELLRDYFGADHADISAIFFEERDGVLRFKSRFRTEVDLVKCGLSPRADALRQKHLERLLDIMDDVLIVPVGKDAYHPRLQLHLAPSGEPGTPGPSFEALPAFQTNPFKLIHDEFVNRKQRLLWQQNGRRNLAACAQLLTPLFSDAAGSAGELCDEVMNPLGLLPFRSHIDARGSQDFDDIRAYPYFSVASPTREPSRFLVDIWSDERRRRRLWEEELLFNGDPPDSYCDQAAEEIMRLHCWSGSMWVMFPIVSLIRGTSHMTDGRVDVGKFIEDAAANTELSRVLAVTKRRLSPPQAPAPGSP
jgi:4-alpha-glucanotransferase